MRLRLLWAAAALIALGQAGCLWCHHGWHHHCCYPAAAPIAR
jgi:hypothetical protein